jgi:uncharacterized membrane protein
MGSIMDDVLDGTPFPIARVVVAPPPPPLLDPVRALTTPMLSSVGPSFLACSASAMVSIGMIWVALVWVYYLLKARQSVSIHPVLRAGVVVSGLTAVLWANLYICNTSWIQPSNYGFKP